MPGYETREIFLLNNVGSKQSLVRKIGQLLNITKETFLPKKSTGNGTWKLVSDLFTLKKSSVKKKFEKI